MIMAAYLLLGESLDSLQLRIAKQNPFFALSETQKDFLTQISKRVKNKS